MQFVLLSILCLLACSQIGFAQDKDPREILTPQPLKSQGEGPEELVETIPEKIDEVQDVVLETTPGTIHLNTASPPKDLASTIRASVAEGKNANSETSCGTCIDYDFMPARGDLRIPSGNSTQDEERAADDPPTDTSNGFRWGPAIRQSLIFLGVQHGYGLTQPKTRSALKGKFFKDYVDSLKGFRGWDDGGKVFTNYIAHPMQGSFTGFIQIQNDPKGMKQRFGKSKEYWHSRMKALAWSAAWSTQWEIGPISQSSIGNVGLYGKQGYVDLVITPTVGIAWLVTEDALDRYLIESIERRTRNFYITIFSRMLFNPTRTMANLIRFKEPWYRDRPRR